MSEKATLLQTIPPVQSASSGGGNASLLSRVPGTEAPNAAVDKQNVAPSELAPALSSSGGSAAAVPGVASVAAPAPAQTITPFQYITYASLVLNFLLAGFVAVVLFKKATKLVDERFSAGVKALAIGSVVVLLHGFFVTYLYASYLNEPSRGVPLFMTMGLWVVLGPFVGYITRNLLARKEKPNRVAALFDGAFYAFIFALAAIGISPSVSTNGALLLTITACFLMIMPIARSLTAFKVAQARHRELKEVSSQILIYGLLLVPALLPLLALVHVFGMNELVTLFLVNFLTLDFIILASCSILIAADNFVEEAEPDTAERAESEDSRVAPAGQAAPAPEHASAPEPARKAIPVAQSSPSPTQAKDQKIVSGNPDDPIIQFLNSEGSEGEEETAATEKKPKGAPRIQPPRKPVHPGLSGTKEPAPTGSKPAPNAPQKVKAPAKPKKRN